MKSNFGFIILSLNFILSFSNPDDFTQKFPFSIKKDINEAAIFLNEKITILKLDNSDILLANDINTPSCSSQEGKGGIYFKGFYYMSCIYSGDIKKFTILSFSADNAGTSKSFFPTTSSFYLKSSGSIRFFKSSSIEETIGVIWVKIINL